MISSTFAKLSRESRARKMTLFREHFDLGPEDRVLDLGSQVDGGAGLLLEENARPENVVACNIGAGHLQEIRRSLPSVHPLLGDGRRLPFADGAFDVVFSNAVIEHVGGLEDQAAMAREIQRVGRRWFVTTPNRWFPFEFHTRMPFYSWLPEGAMSRAARLWSYSHTERRYRSGIERARTRLMSQRELQRLFPTSLVVPVRVTLWPETFVVVGPA